MGILDKYARIPLYIPLRSDKTEQLNDLRFCHLHFISHYVQIKLDIDAKRASDCESLYPTTFR